MFNSNSMSPADIAACSNCNNGFGNDSSWFLWIIVILALFNGNGWGGYGASGGVVDQYTLASDFATIQRQIDTTTASTQGLINNSADQLQRQITSVANGLSSLGYDQLNQFNNVNTNVANSRYDLSTQLNNIAATQQSCCCATNNNITSGFADLNYNLATQSCNTRQTITDGVRSIIDNDNANYRAIDAKLTAMEMSAKDDKIASLTSDVQALRFAASQQAQNAYLISQLNPTPIPAYPASNLYGSSCPCSCAC